jgi:hypothetical protein
MMAHTFSSLISRVKTLMPSCLSALSSITTRLIRLPPRSCEPFTSSAASSRALRMERPYAALSPVSVSTAPILISGGRGAADRAVTTDKKTQTSAASSVRFMIWNFGTDGAFVKEAEA